IEPKPRGAGDIIDTVGIVTTFEGDPLQSGDIASRLGGFEDLGTMEKGGAEDAKLIESVLGSKNSLHNNYQDFQAFLDKGGKIGLQHDPLLYGAYALNPFLVSVEMVPMLVVKQGEVAVVKAYVGLVTEDTSGIEFKFGSLVRPGHRGIWRESLRTGKYPINPHCYQAEVVPTAILTLNWADAVSKAHNLDAQLQQIIAKSREGFVFKIDLQVQIHVADTKAPRVISMVGTMLNLVTEVLQAAVGNHFRDKLQSMPAIRFIETRQQVQEEAFAHISKQLEQYQVETKGVYIQDVILPEDLVKVLTSREIANQEIETFKKQKEAQDQRITTEQAKGTADMQAALAQSKVGVDIKTNNANARKAEADGEAAYIRETGAAKGAEVEAVGMARAKAYEAQVKALGQTQTAVVNAITALADKGAKVMPEILVAGGGTSSLDGLAATLMKYLGPKSTPPATK
ncbi:MAG TPA: SPFH domain-containing protein, partial [Candidatus Edwardsbacteria bacterium]|nr:SPFH domain-containing protein [Candidatus Edwardsbacteria bacterium]